MNKEDAKKAARQHLKMMIEIKRDENKLKDEYIKPLEEEYKTHQARLIPLMKELGEETLEIDGEGRIKHYEQESTRKLDEEAIAQALGLKNLDKYVLPRTKSDRVRLTIEKK